MTSNNSSIVRAGVPHAPLEEIARFNRRFRQADPDTILKWSWNTFGKHVVLGTGFGPSGVVLLHRISLLGLEIPLFYLDTQLLFKETYDLRDELERRLELSFIRIGTSLSLEEQERQYGVKLWESNPDKCCFLRKVLPLQNFLKEKKGWITGLRRDQSESRRNTEIVEWDPGNGVLKINPLAHWNSNDVWEYIDNNDLPYNPLHDAGYPSIGCWPCTTPIADESSERSGRWRGRNKIECGIHLPTQNGKNNFEL